MPLEPVLLFILVRYLRKKVRTFFPRTELDRVLTFSQYGLGALLLLQLLVFKKAGGFALAWHAIFIMIVAATFKRPELKGEQPVIFAILPFFSLWVLCDIIELLNKSFYNLVENYIDIGYAVAITWMITMLIKSNKQKKALESERSKTKEEEERNKFMALQKAELEKLVAERTSEIMDQKNELQEALTVLQSTQKQLIHSEKMASLGELTAGIAHEIQNPLNFVNNFSEINTELIDEMHAEIVKGNFNEVEQLASDIKNNEQKIIYHGRRADAIVKGMLLHSRNSSGIKEPTDINALADEYFRLAYHGLRAKDKSFNCTIKTNFDQTIPKINITPQDIGRVLLNMFNNAFYAVTQKKQSSLLQEGAAKPVKYDYEPTVTVGTGTVQLPTGIPGVSICVKDNGTGIPQKVLGKIYQPFFTTKPTGQGTGLGLSLSYDIIKAHSGEIRMNTQEGAGSEFIIELPANQSDQ